MKLFSSLSLTTVLFAVFFLAPSAHAQLLSSITVEQVTASELGTWTLISENGSTITSSDPAVDSKKYTAAVSSFGQMTLRINPPSGMIARITIYRGSNFVENVDSLQHSFPLLTNDTYRFVIQYRISATGTLGIISEQGTVIFRVESTSGRTYKGRTPFTLKDLPIGKYTISANAIDGCFTPPVKNVQVQQGERQTIKISLTCEDAEDTISVLRVRPSKRSLVNDVTIQNARRSSTHR